MVLLHGWSGWADTWWEAQGYGDALAGNYLLIAMIGLATARATSRTTRRCMPKP